MPLKMVIADNELEIRDRITRCIDGTACDVKIVGVAQNCSDLVRQCREKRPDICLLDIGLPQWAGLEPLETIRKLLPEIRVLISSRGDDPEHEKQVVSSGVTAYIRKPLDEALLIQILKKTAESIRKEQKSAELLKYGQKSLRAEKLHMFEPFMHKWILRQYSAEGIDYMLRELNLKSPGSYTLMLVDHPAFEVTKIKLLETKEQNSALHRALEKLMKIKKEVLWASLTPRRSLAIIYSAPDEVPAVIPTESLEIAAKQLGIELHVVSRTVQSIEEDFQGAYEELCLSLEQEMKGCPIIKSAEHLIETGFMNKKLSLNLVAQNLHISPQYLSRMFKSEMGMSFSEYLIHTRMQHAINLILSTNATIQEIADLVGYRSQHYFSTAFKKATSCCPKEYRMKHEGLSRPSE